MNGSTVVILVADDEEFVRNMIAAVVRTTGYEVLIASDGEKALDISRRYQGHIDLLISDIMMPGMNGIELARQVTRERPAIKVLLVSGKSDVPIPRQFHFLAKPFTIPALQQAMIDLLLALS